MTRLAGCMFLYASLFENALKLISVDASYRSIVAFKILNNERFAMLFLDILVC